MTTTQFFVMIKPDAVRRGLVGEIISRFEKRNFHIRSMQKIVPDKDTVKWHYHEHSESSYYSSLVDFTCSGDIVIMVLEGNIKAARDIVGSTHPWESMPGTIRGDYACSLPENLIHCSRDIESAKREIDLWFP